MFGQVGEERDDVMFGLAFNFVDLINLKSTVIPDRLKRLLWVSP